MNVRLAEGKGTQPHATPTLNRLLIHRRHSPRTHFQCELRPTQLVATSKSGDDDEDRTRFEDLPVIELFLLLFLLTFLAAFPVGCVLLIYGLTLAARNLFTQR